MKTSLSALIVVVTLWLASTGCGEKTSTTKETTISTPGGTTTVTTEKEVEKTGDNPPAEQP